MLYRSTWKDKGKWGYSGQDFGTVKNQIDMLFIYEV